MAAAAALLVVVAAAAVTRRLAVGLPGQGQANLNSGAFSKAVLRLVKSESPPASESRSPMGSPGHVTGRGATGRPHAQAAEPARPPPSRAAASVCFCACARTRSCAGATVPRRHSKALLPASAKRSAFPSLHESSHYPARARLAAVGAIAG